MNAAEPGFERDRIRHIIVVMMENRSFDHLLGYLQHDDPSYPNLDRVRAGCPEDPDDPRSRWIPTSPDASRVLGVNPDHSAAAVMLQLYGRPDPRATERPTMTGFVRSYRLKIDGSSPHTKSRLTRIVEYLSALRDRIRRVPAPVLPGAADIMKCFPEADVPVLSKLAKEYAVLVNWHSSVPGETWPNRNFAHAATSDGETAINVRWYNNDTIYERLAAAGRRWGVYHDGISQVWAFWRLWIRVGRPSTPTENCSTRSPTTPCPTTPSWSRTTATARAWATASIPATTSSAMRASPRVRP